MTRLITTLVVLLLIGLGVLALVSRPPIAEPTRSTIDERAVPMCLGDVAERYRPEYLTFAGSFRAWWLGSIDKLTGLNDPRDQADLANFVMLQEAVDCYTRFSGDNTLNLRQSRTAFVATFNSFAKHYRMERTLP